MKKNLILKQGFTLIELIVAITIFSVIMLSIFFVYSNIITVNKKLELYRILQENSRKITETIAKDIREKGINFDYYDNSQTYKTLDYTGSGNTILAVNGGNMYYSMENDELTGNTTDCKNLTQECFLGLANGSTTTKINGSDVQLKNLRFFISGKGYNELSNNEQEGKVTIVLDLGLSFKRGLASTLAKDSFLRVQTTISEKYYKNSDN